MEPEQEPAGASSSPPPSAAPKKSWDTVLTTTPVILTVLGTVLAGLSNSEMTLAQYFRTLAAQSQSKVADQWGFYQAKRIRGTTMEAMLDLLPIQARPGKMKYGGLLNALHRLQSRQDAAQQALTHFITALDRHKNDLPPELAKALRDWSKELERLGQDRRTQLTALLEKCTVSVAADAAMKRGLTLVTENRWDDAESPTPSAGPVETAVAALHDNKSHAEITPLLGQIKPDEVRRAIDGAETNARNLNSSLSRTSQAIDQLSTSIAEQLQGTIAFHEQMERYEDLLVSSEKVRSVMPAELTDALAKLQRSDSAAVTGAEDLKNVFTGLEKTFTSRRYKLEADTNQQIAYLYEIQVRLESQRADRYRHRSLQFFYGLLAAQAGVAISSLSLAARQKSVLWALAGLAGLTALVFSLYVYVYV